MTLVPSRLASAPTPQSEPASLQIGCSFKLNVLARHPGRPEDEAAAHKALADSRLEGEWFRRDEAVLIFINRLRRGVVGLDVYEFNEWDEVSLTPGSKDHDEWLALKTKYESERQRLSTRRLSLAL